MAKSEDFLGSYLSNGKKTWLVGYYIGDYSTQLYGDYYKNQYKDLY